MDSAIDAERTDFLEQVGSLTRSDDVFSIARIPFMAKVDGPNMAKRHSYLGVRFRRTGRT